MNLYLFVLSTGILTLSMERVMSIFFEKRRVSLPVTILSYLLFFGAVMTSLWLQPIVIYIYLFVFALIIISLNYEAVAIKRLSAVAGCYLILIVPTSVARIFIYLLPNDLSFGTDIAYLIAVIITYLMVLLAFRRFKHIKHIEKTTMYYSKLWLPLCFIPVVDIISTSLWTLNILYVTEHYDRIIAIGTALIIFYLYNNLSKAFAENVKSALHAQEKDYYYAQCQLMQESVENIKSIRHDMKFHLATAREFTANNKTKEAAAYLDGLLSSIEKNELYSNTKNTAFDSIINFKLNNAKQENIKLDIRLLIPPVLNIEVADIVTIMGNLLDNAIDAVSNVEEKMIKLDIEYSRESLFIQVENTFDGVVQYTKGAEGEGSRIISRKEGGEHGHGLKNIRKSVEKYNGHIDISHNENIFSVGVLLYISDIHN